MHIRLDYFIVWDCSQITSSILGDGKGGLGSAKRWKRKPFWWRSYNYHNKTPKHLHLVGKVNGWIELSTKLLELWYQDIVCGWHFSSSIFFYFLGIWVLYIRKYESWNHIEFKKNKILQAFLLINVIKVKNNFNWFSWL